IQLCFWFLEFGSDRRGCLARALVVNLSPGLHQELVSVVGHLLRVEHVDASSPLHACHPKICLKSTSLPIFDPSNVQCGATSSNQRSCERQRHVFEHLFSFLVFCCLFCCRTKIVVRTRCADCNRSAMPPFVVVH